MKNPNVYIIRFETYGIKNIEKKITIDFSNITVAGNIKQRSIKAIYGMNGTGKSAIINSIDLYKKINTDKDYLSQKNNIRMLSKLINKKNQKFYFKMVYAVRDKFLQINEVYAHEILLSIEQNDIYIEKEQLSRLIDRTVNGNFLTLYNVVNGKIVEYSDHYGNAFKHLNEISVNTLNDRTLTSIMVSRPHNIELANIIKNYSGLSANHFEKAFFGMFYLQLLMQKIYIYLETSDIHSEIDFEQAINAYVNANANNKILYKISQNDELILINQFEEYEKQIERLCLFLQIFKPDLKSITIDKKIDDEFYHCSKVLNYDGYSIDSDYESTGIKKLMTLFTYLDKACNGDCVFIDELDANLNGIYLERLLEYFIEYGKGLLCYTIHNTDSMDMLGKIKGSIYFLGETGKLVQWTKNGNYSPLKRYKEGMITDSPFNVSVYDFLKVFGGNEK